VKGASKAPQVLSSFFKISKKQVKVNQSNFEETQKNIEKEANKEFKKKNRVIALGGDHSITYGVIKAASKIYKNLSLLYFDAHMDAEDDFLPPSHEDLIKAIVNNKIIKPENILMIGIRKFWEKEHQFIVKNKIKVLFASEDKNKIALKIKNFVKNKEKIYISVDIDFFDKSIAFATGYPEKNGFFLEDFKKFTTDLEFNRIIGFDLVEVTPSLDKDHITTTLASNVLKYLLSKSGENTETYI